MEQEIGSEFWDVPTTDDYFSFPKSTQWFISGRSALQAILRENTQIRSVALPSWCCDCMIKPFVNAGVDICFYPVVPSDDGLSQDIHKDCDALLLMDYFGFTDKQPDLTGYNGIVIRDVTHSFFSKTYEDANYYYGSLRKWCGIWTGGFAWTQDGHEIETGDKSSQKYIRLRERAMRNKEVYIKNGGDKRYLDMFKEAEDMLDTIGIEKAAERDLCLAKKLNIELIRNRRKINAEVLMSELQNLLIFRTINSDDIPLFIPILVPDGKRGELQEFLIKHEIYCPVHWPVSNYHSLTEETAILYDNELSLICDQRYTENDMYRMVKTIKSFLKEA